MTCREGARAAAPWLRRLTVLLWQRGRAPSLPRRRQWRRSVITPCPLAPSPPCALQPGARFLGLRRVHWRGVKCVCQLRQESLLGTVPSEQAGGEKPCSHPGSFQS